VHNRSNFASLDFALIIGLSANKIDYTRADLLANQGLIVGYNKDLSFDKSFELSFNPHIALQKTINKQIFNLSYSEGYNAPTAATAFITAIGKVNDALLPEKANMLDFSVHGLVFKNRLDYQFSVFSININNKLTQLSGINPVGGTYSYFANTGNQHNQGLELSLNYALLKGDKKAVFSKIETFVNMANYNFKYSNFKTLFGGDVVDYTNKQVVGLPQNKYTIGLDIQTNAGLYLNNTLNTIGDVYTDFANTNQVKGFTLLNSKIGYQHCGSKIDVDVFLAGNNLSNQINYTFLFLGNSVSDSDPGNGYAANIATDVNPGASRAYFWGGFNIKVKL
jgi:iron complex outermembrane receptor protein